ncbi:MAG: GAF domain-containing protein [Campylobacterota bacterium]|nr:GAF domain-containing protein [Campylobacterota bacterium]
MKYASSYSKLADFGRELLIKKSLADGLPLISKSAKDIIGADRCSIFINDLEKKELWTTISDGVDKIIIPQGKGIVGQTIKEERTILVNDVYSNQHFMADIDEETGYTTKNIIATPIFNSDRDVIGVLELLNKENGFDEADMKFTKFFAHYISGFLELILFKRRIVERG